MTTDDLAHLSRHLDQCMVADRDRLRRRLQRLRGPRGRRKSRNHTESPDQIATAIQDAIDRRTAREASIPTPRYPADLPVVMQRETIIEAIRNHPVVVVCGETGSGKTTQLPKLCLEAGRGRAGFIGHTQPRRIAARSVAARIAQELGVTLGSLVGYTVRFQDQTSAESLIKVMTDGILLAETQSDRRLLRYDTIIIDEAHERSLNIDFLLGYLRQLSEKRNDLKIIITSATIDPLRFSEHFRGAPIIEVEGRTYPVETRYRPLLTAGDEAPDRDIQQAILDAVDEVAAEGQGDILIFLPGEREIRETAKALRAVQPSHTEVLPLYARLSAADQDRVFKPHPGRRIVLATNVAETSLTVPGIRYVIDPGLARISRYSARRKVQMLPIEPISQASANQRAGRCGRMAEGICIRLYAEDDFRRRDEFTPPEIVRTNLAAVMLQMHALGFGSVERFPFMEPPRRAMVRDGVNTLHELGALDDDERLTELGRRLTKLPVDPRIARMILEAEKEHCLDEILVIASALSVQDPRDRPLEHAGSADTAHERFINEDSDFLTFLNLWEFWHSLRPKLSWNKLRLVCKQNFISFLRMREWIDVHTQLRRIARESGMRINPTPADRDAIHRSLLAGLLSNIALRGDSHAYAGAGGKEVFIFPGSAQFKTRPTWIMAAEIVETTRPYARIVAPIQPAWVERLASHLVKRSYTDPVFQAKSSRVMATETVRLWGLEIVPRRSVHYGPIDPVVSRRVFIQAMADRDYRSDAPFMEHNDALIDEVETLQAKSRRRDLLADASMFFAFYDARIGPDVFSGRRLDQWRKQAERRDPRILHMTINDLMIATADHVTIERFPDSITLNGASYPLVYRLEPGVDDDGVTAVIPVEALGQVDSARLDWLVPGMIEEKLVALMRTLPKSIRRNFVPAPDFAAACIDRMPFAKDLLIDVLSEHLRTLTGVEIPRDAWDRTTLPMHLTMNIRVVDAAGDVLCEGRSLETLRRTVGSAAREALADADDADQYTRDHVTDWDFGDLPRETSVTRGAATLTAYPALEMDQQTVCLRLFERADLADVAHFSGARRLMALQLHGEVTSLLDQLPDIDSVRLMHASLASQDALHDDLANAIIEAACLPDGIAPRTERDFRQRVDHGFGKLWSAGLIIVDLARQILQARHDLLTELDRAIPPQWNAAVNDIRRHATALVPPGFLCQTPAGWREHLPRFLAADLDRFRKLAHGGHTRDAANAAMLTPLLEAYAERANALRSQRLVDSALDDYRWMLEEYRVTLFAQERGTSVPVSAKRLKKLWEQVQR